MDRSHSHQWTWLRLPTVLLLSLAASGVGRAQGGAGDAQASRAPGERTQRPAEQLLGERLFQETRFAQFFMVNSHGDVNAHLKEGDPTVAVEVTADGDTLPGPMRGKTMNCAQCHLGTQEAHVQDGGTRVFADFARRTPIPHRSEDLVHGGFTPRNSTSIVTDVLHGDVDPLVHWDGQFDTMQNLVAGTLPGRVFGWLATEKAQSQHQVAQVIRGDDGNNALAREFSGGFSYATLFNCTQPVPAAYQLPAQYCVDLSTATDVQVVNAVAAAMAAYLNTLDFARDQSGQHDGSPYDHFLIKNGLPRSPAAGQSASDYAGALLGDLKALRDPQFVDEGHFRYHDHQAFVFGPRELRGLITFLSHPAGATPTAREVARGGMGNCAACHTPPEFTDFELHANGSAQFEYDSIHGLGSFAQLFIPTLDQRNANPNAYLPVTAAHPDATETFRMAPSAAAPGHTDLGVWNIFANPDFASRKASLRKFLCAIDTHQFADCGASDAALLDRSIAVFHTHSLRDLGDSSPYMHTGQFDTLEAVVRFYETSGALARAGKLRNADGHMQSVVLTDDDVADLSAFLASLNEDYTGGN